MSENWKAIPDWEGFYEVSDLGRVRSVDRVTRHGRRRKSQLIADRPVAGGYRLVNLSADGEKGWTLVHRAVLEAFVGPCPVGMEGCHNDGDRSSNNLSNLRWDTPKNNHADRAAHGTLPIGERSPSSKLTEVQVREIRAVERRSGVIADLAIKYGVSKKTIENIRCGQSWKATA